MSQCSSESFTDSADEASFPNPPIKKYVYISIDLEATTEQFELYPPRGPRAPGKGTVYPTSTPTQLGISILRATGENANLFAKDPASKAGIKFRHIQIKELMKYKTRIWKLRRNSKFLYGQTELVPLAMVNQVVKSLIEEESKHGQIVLVGHAIQNDQKFLHNANITAFDEYFPAAVDTQVIHRDGGSPSGLATLVHLYDEHAGEGWHNAGNDAMWTLWVLANKLGDLYMLSESKEELVLDYSHMAKYIPKKNRQQTYTRRSCLEIQRFAEEYDNW